MKSLLVLVTVGLLGVGLSACGANESASSSSSPAAGPKTAPISTIPTKVPPEPVKTSADADKDYDVGTPEDDTNSSVLDFGHAANTTDTRSITALIKRYYAAAYAENGAQACTMLYSTLEEVVPQDYGQSPPGQPYMRGTTCAAVLTLLFKHDHPQLALEHPRLEVAHVRLMEHHGIVILSFGKLPIRQIPVAREGHTWKLSALLDSEVS
jgi:hypothetical protein